MSLTKSLLRHSSNLLFSGTLVMALTTFSAAQSDTPPPPPPRGMMHGGGGPMGDFLHSDIGEGKQVKGAPLTAELVVTRDTALANGTHIHNVTETKIYRDAEGRTRREIGVELNTPATGSVKRTMIVLVDPVAGKRYMLNADNKIARQMPIRHGGPNDRPPHDFGDSNAIKTEQLGTKTINGLQAEGTRVTRTIPAGEIGNDKAIEVVTERWVSTELQVPLLVTHNDPMMGVVTSTLTNITRAEPDAALFVVPSDYKIEAGRAGDPFLVPPKP